MATATKTKTATFKIKSFNNLILFLKRFSGIEKSLLLELTADHLLAKSHTADRSTIKYSKIALGDVLEGTVPAELTKIAILDINKVINVYKHFGDGDEIFLDMSYDEINSETIAFNLKFYTKKLKITLSCADPIQFTYISPDALKRIVKSVADDKIMEFPFPKEAFAKINSLCGIDTASDLLKIRVNDKGEVYFKGKSFEYQLLDVPPGKEVDMSFYNNQFGYIDTEISSFHLSGDKMLVKSTESDTMIILGKIE